MLAPVLCASPFENTVEFHTTCGNRNGFWTENPTRFPLPPPFFSIPQQISRGVWDGSFFLAGPSFSVVCIWCTAELTVRGVHLWCTYDAPPSWQSVVLRCTAELTVRGVHMMHRRWCTAESTVRGVHMMHRRIMGDWLERVIHFTLHFWYLWNNP